MQVEINPQLLNWAIERSMKDIDNLVDKFSSLPEWQNQTKNPTYKQLERFAKATFTPIGMFFLSTPPDELLPINDFRTLANNNYNKPSANLLDTIYASQQRQAWYQTYRQQQGLDKLAIVGKYTVNDNPTEVAQALIKMFEFHHNYSSWQQALSERTRLIEQQGILVMSSGIALGNTRRALELDEFRGFALSDEYAPVIFINAKDSIAARSFTLMHELAHIVIAENGVSNTDNYGNNQNTIENWCNQVAAEILVPSAEFRQKYQHGLADLNENLNNFAKYFKVSTLVVLGRIYELDYIDVNTFWVLFKTEKEKIAKILAEQKTKKPGGNYYNNKSTSVSKLFIKTITASTLEGKTLYRDAMQLLEVKKIKTFKKLTNKIHPWSI